MISIGLFSEVKKQWNIGEDTDESLFDTRSYAFYRFSLTFTVSVPDEVQLEIIDKNSRFDQTSLVFWPSRVIFNNGVETENRELTKDRHKIPVVVSLMRKPGGGYYDILLRKAQGGYELTCE